MVILGEGVVIGVKICGGGLCRVVVVILGVQIVDLEHKLYSFVSRYVQNGVRFKTCYINDADLVG